MTGFIQLGAVFVIVSLLVMIGLSVAVYVGGSRRRSGPEYVTFEEGPEVVPLQSERREQPEADLFQPERDPEPAVTHPIHEDSGALDRLLAGVQLPCGLERLYPDGEDELVRRAYVTVGYDARVVAVSVVDELERLGMDIEPLSFTEARAWRDGLELAVTIYLEPKRVIRFRRPAFPGAAPDSVVLEFSVA
ncbi:MAG: hypothetical protein GEV08_19260 [Acidimicrobiia bacterium]|nr:hypothetical protein [Acidimicrobiia bacterium]